MNSFKKELFISVHGTSSRLTPLPLDSSEAEKKRGHMAGQGPPSHGGQETERGHLIDIAFKAHPVTYELQ